MTIPAVILVGGEGTRLRPLTESTPKPMLPLGDRPLLAYTFEHLARHGVDRAILSCGYLPTQIEEFFGEEWGGVSLEYRVEPEPLGTAGALRFGAEGLSGTFLGVNGDTIRGADLSRLVELHQARGAQATILLEPVDDPSRYGLVRTDEDGRVRGFLEKPQPEEIDTNLINAGVYVLEPEVLELVPPGLAVSIERDVFPKLVGRGTCYGFALGGYWLDVGTPESYLQAHLDLLAGLFPGSTDDGATVEPDARVDRSVLGDGAVVESGAHVEESVLHAGARVGRGARVRRAIVGAGATVGAGAVVEELAVVGPSAHVPDRNRLAAGERLSVTDHLESPNIDSLDPWAFEARRVEKPWGYELIWALSETYCGKILFVQAGCSLSLQFHREKDESWLVQSGRARVQLGQPGDTILNEEIVGAGAAFRYRPGTVHRVTAIEDTTILEVSTPHLDDVVRLDDEYGRS